MGTELPPELAEQAEQAKYRTAGFSAPSASPWNAPPGGAWALGGWFHGPWGRNGHRGRPRPIADFRPDHEISRGHAVRRFESSAYY